MFYLTIVKKYIPVTFGWHDSTFYSLLALPSADNLYEEFGPRIRGYKTFFMLNSAEHKIYHGKLLKCQQSFAF